MLAATPVEMSSRSEDQSRRGDPGRLRRGTDRPVIRTPIPQPAKRAVLVAQALANEIATLEPGDVLQPEREMIAQFQVGRGTLREALRILELQGLVTVKAGPRGGPVVNHPGPWALAQTLSILLQSSDITFEEVLDARQTIEIALAGLAAEHRSEDDITALEEALETMAEYIDDEDAFLAENAKFHQRCGAAAQSAVLSIFLESLRTVSDGHAIGVRYSPRQRQAILEYHREIARAIAAADVAASQEAMEEHMRQFIKFMRRHYREILRRPIKWVISTG
jgi:GntR family transcriptional regulator, transcriptional repressor for pyruvate dehydrogenase complex